jgi:hypothetical protein
MDIITAGIYIILFILLMVFVFSMGLLTPIIGKKDILSVLAIGFIVGLVGGVFFITPIYHEIPNVVGSFQQTFSSEPEKINIEVSPITDLNKLITDLNKTEGVITVINKGIEIKTDPFPPFRQKIIEEKIPIVDENFKNFSVNKSGLININFTVDHNPNDAIKLLADWLMYTGEINTRYSLINIQIVAEPSKVDNVIEFLNSEDIVVTSIEGPVQDSINNTRNSLINDNLAIVLCGVAGLIVAFISIYIDEITLLIKKILKKIKEVLRKIIIKFYDFKKSKSSPKIKKDIKKSNKQDIKKKNRNKNNNQEIKKKNNNVDSQTNKKDDSETNNKDTNVNNNIKNNSNEKKF